MMKTAEQGQVLQIAGAAVRPLDDVMRLRPLGRAVATGKAAAAVAGNQREPLPRGCGAACASVRQHTA